MTGTGLKKYEARQHFGATGSRCQVLRGTSEYNYAGFEIDDGIFPRKKRLPPVGMDQKDQFT